MLSFLVIFISFFSFVFVFRIFFSLLFSAVEDVGWVFHNKIRHRIICVRCNSCTRLLVVQWHHVHSYNNISWLYRRLFCYMHVSTNKLGMAVRMCVCVNLPLDWFCACICVLSTVCMHRIFYCNKWCAFTCHRPTEHTSLWWMILLIRTS